MRVIEDTVLQLRGRLDCPHIKQKHHNYLTLVSDHGRRKVVWGAEDKDAATLDGFFDELGQERSGTLTAAAEHTG